jgi:hypothetical protein
LNELSVNAHRKIRLGELVFIRARHGAEVVPHGQDTAPGVAVAGAVTAEGGKARFAGALLDVELAGRAGLGRAHLAVDHSYLPDERISAKSSPAGEQNGRGGDL